MLKTLGLMSLVGVTVCSFAAHATKEALLEQYNQDPAAVKRRILDARADFDNEVKKLSVARASAEEAHACLAKAVVRVENAAARLSAVSLAAVQNQGAEEESDEDMSFGLFD